MLWEILGVPVELEGGSIVGWSCATYLGGIADLKESGSSIEHCGLLAWELGGLTRGRLGWEQVPMGMSAMVEEWLGQCYQKVFRAGPIGKSGIGGGVEDAGRVGVGK